MQVARSAGALREQEAVGEDAGCFHLDSTSTEVHPDGTGARKTNGPQSIGKSRGGWNTEIHMGVSHDSWLITIGTLEPCRQGCVFRRACSAAAA